MKKFQEIENELREMAEKEALKLWRLARRAIAHGCKQELVNAIREETWWLHSNATAHPGWLLDSDYQYKTKYVFKLGGK